MSTAMQAPARGNGRYDKNLIKTAAAGRWAEIITALAGIDAELLDGRHHPCPKCGGKDRFRWDREKEFAFCNGCFSEGNGDGFAAIQHFRGVGFPEALALAGEHLGIQPSRNGQAKTSGRAKQHEKPPGLLRKVKWISLDPDQWNAIVSEWCKHKPPITPEAVEAFRGRFCRWPAKGSGTRCLAFPGYNSKRELKALLLYRLDGKPFPAFKGLGERKTHLVGGSRESWLVPGRLDDLASATTLIKCEGMTDALALWSIGLPEGWIPITNACGAKSANPEKLDFSIGSGKRIPVLGDADKPGREGAQRFTVAFFEAGAGEVRIPLLPYQEAPDHGRDLRDWLAEGHGAEDFAALVEASAPVTEKQVAGWVKKSDKPQILVGFDEARVADEAIRAIANEPNLYQRGSKLVQVLTDAKPPRGIARPEGAPRIAMLRHARLREIMAAHAKWAQPTDDGYVPCHLPRWAVEAVAAREQWKGIRPIEGVVESPVLRADGTILQQPGYDALTGLLFQPRGAFPEIPERLTIDDARRAREAILESVADFPFATPAHRAAWLAATLTPFARFAFFGCAPLNLIDANVRGVGKGLLADVIGAIFCWRGMSRMTKAGDDDEFRKRITALAIAGDPLILIDNIAGFLASPSLDAALTATSWSDRVLGKSEMVTDVPLTATWYATTNNAILGADTARRVLHIRLESPEEKPEERSGFRQPKLLEWVQREQPRLAAAAVSILAAFCQAGRQDMKLRPWGSFEAWSELVRQAVVWAGLPDPAETRTELADQADTEGNALRLLIDALEDADPGRGGLTAAEMLKLIDHDRDDYHAALRNAITELVPVKGGGVPSTRSLGMKLRHLRRRVVGGRFLDRRDVRRGALWSVHGGKKCDSSDSSDSTLPLSATRARTHAHAHAGEVPKVESPESPEPHREDDCVHPDVEETATHDGYANRTCRTCGKNLGCRTAEPTP